MGKGGYGRGSRMIWRGEKCLFYGLSKRGALKVCLLYPKVKMELTRRKKGGIVCFVEGVFSWRG
jgi:hypothetical protein